MKLKVSSIMSTVYRQPDSGFKKLPKFNILYASYSQGNFIILFLNLLSGK